LLFSFDIDQGNATSMPGEMSFTTFINRHFNIQSSTININDGKKRKKLAKSFSNNIADEDAIDDVLF
jgi:hypothetical protein